MKIFAIVSVFVCVVLIVTFIVTESKVKHEKPTSLKELTINGQRADLYYKDLIYKAFEMGCKDGMFIVEYQHKNIHTDSNNLCSKRVLQYKKAVEK